MIKGSAFHHRIVPFFSADQLIFIIAAASLVISSVGIAYGMPLHLIGDEESIIGGALKMLELRTLVPTMHSSAFDFLYYPVGIPYLIIIFSLPLLFVKAVMAGFSLQSLADFFVFNQQGIWLSARIVSLVASTAMIFVIGALGRLVYSARVGIIAAALLSVSFLHVSAAHWMRHWMLATLLVYLAIYLTIRFVEKKDISWWLPAVVVGLSVGVSYISLMSLVFVIPYLFVRRTRIDFFTKVFLWSVVIIFLIAAFFSALHIGELIELLGPEEGSALTPKSLGGLLGVIGYGARVLFYQEPIVIIAALAALFAGFHIRRLAIVIFLFILSYFSVLYFLFHIEVRYVYLVVPALAVAAASWIDYGLNRFPRAALLYFSFGLLFAFALVVRYDFLLLRDDTRVLAREWVRNRLVGTEFILSSPSIFLDRTRHSLDSVRAYESFRSRDRYLSDNFERVSSVADPRYTYTNLNNWLVSGDLDTLSDYLAENPPQYFILEFWSQSDLDGYDYSLIAGSELVKEFRQSSLRKNLDINGNFFSPNLSLLFLKRLGATVRVYRLYE